MNKHARLSAHRKQLPSLLQSQIRRQQCGTPALKENDMHPLFQKEYAIFVSQNYFFSS